MSVRPILLRVHIWAGLILGVFMLFWLASGVVMTWFDIDRVRGAHTTAAAPKPILPTEGLVPAQRILSVAEGPGIVSVTLRSLLGAPVYETANRYGQTMLFDAATGARLDPLPEETALAIAKAGFKGDTDRTEIAWITEPVIEHRGAYPVWQVRMNDPGGTRLYVSPETGHIVARRNDIWRIYDFFWMLHILDFEERSDFNAPLVKGASAAGLVFVLSGLWLLFLRHSRALLFGDLRWLGRAGRRRRTRTPRP